MDSWRELRGLLIAVVVTLLRVHILCRIRKGVVFLVKASAADWAYDRRWCSGRRFSLVCVLRSCESFDVFFLDRGFAVSAPRAISVLFL